MLVIGKGDRKAREVPVLQEDVEVARIRTASPPAEHLTVDAGDSVWSLECSWDGGYRNGKVVGRSMASSVGAPVLHGRYIGDDVRDVVLEGRALEVSRKSTLKGMHRYTEGGRWVAETDIVSFLRGRPTLTDDGTLPLHQQIFLLCLDLYSCRRNSSASRALGFVQVRVH